MYKNGDKTWHRNDKLIEEENQATDLITNDAIDFINKKRETDDLFLLYISYTVAHSPVDEPEEWINLYSNSIDNESRRKFAASVTHMDNSISKLLDNIEKSGIKENTIVMFLSDNGGQKSWSSETEYGGKFKLMMFSAIINLYEIGKEHYMTAPYEFLPYSSGPGN